MKYFLPKDCGLHITPRRKLKEVKTKEPFSRVKFLGKVLPLKTKGTGKVLEGTLIESPKRIKDIRVGNERLERIQIALEDNSKAYMFVLPMNVEINLNSIMKV